MIGPANPELPKVLADRKNELLAIVASYGLERRPTPVTLSSKAQSNFFVDAKQALSNGQHLRLACEWVIGLAEALNIDWNAVGGRTMGADPLAHGIALLTGKRWFSVRKEAKPHGTMRTVEAVSVSHDTRVLLVDDVATTGGSISTAYEAVTKDGAVVVLATVLVDRGNLTRLFFEERKVPYVPLLTYEDLNIPAFGTEVLPQASSN